MSRTGFVLAAGLGTRLRPLTEHRPKPLVPVAGVPMLAYALALCARHGMDRVVVNAHHLAEQILPWTGLREGVDVAVAVEAPEILGTGGGLRAVRHHLAERFVVVNADVLSDVDLAALRDAVPPGGAAMALRPHAEDAARYGVVAADATGTVVRLARVAQAEAEGPVALDTHFTGLHALDRSTLERVPDGFACIVRTAYAELVPERRVRGLRHPGTWLDVGDPAAYLAANRAVLDGAAVPLDPFPRAAHAVRPGRVHGDASGFPGLSVDGTAWIGPGARLGRGVRLEASVVGHGASVPADTRLRRCVVWDGADVPPGDHADTIFHDGGALTVTESDDGSPADAARRE